MLLRRTRSWNRPAWPNAHAPRRMLRNTFLKTLRDQGMAAVWWSIGLVAISFYAMFLYPAIRESVENTVGAEHLDELPEAVAGGVSGGVLDYSTAAGFLSAQMFSVIIPIVMLAYAITRGSHAVAGEEEKGTLEILLANPLPRWRMIVEKTASLVVATVGLGIVLWLGMAVGSLLAGVELSLVDLTAAITSVVLFAICGGMITLAVGAATGRRALSVAITVTVLVAGFLINALYKLVEELEPFRYLSIYYYYYDNTPILFGLSTVHASILAGISVVMFVFAIVAFWRRDLHG